MRLCALPDSMGLNYQRIILYEHNSARPVVDINELLLYCYGNTKSYDTKQSLEYKAPYEQAAAYYGDIMAGIKEALVMGAFEVVLPDSERYIYLTVYSLELLLFMIENAFNNRQIKEPYLLVDLSSMMCTALGMKNYKYQF